VLKALFFFYFFFFLTEGPALPHANM